MTDERRNPNDLDALKDGAGLLLQAGNRVAALTLLWSAVAIDPTDLGSHRRLAATLANGGDVDRAAEEFARYIEFMLPLGDVGRAALELSYGVQMLGGHDALRAAAEKVADAVRAIVPPTNAAIAPNTSLLADFDMPMVAEPVPAAVQPTPAAAPPAPFPAPRLLPKVPFRFCLHDAGDRHWMQLEGGVDGLVPDAVRIIDRAENVIDSRLCMPLARGEGHGDPTTLELPPVAWVVLQIPDHIATAFETGLGWDHTFQAKVNDEWLALDLVDTGCRLGRRTVSAS